MTTNHKLIIKNTDRIRDAYEIGIAQFINGVNGQIFEFAVWCDDDFNEDSVEDFSCFLWLNSPTTFESLNNMNKEDIDAVFNDVMFTLQLDDLLKNSFEIRSKLKNWINNDIPFECEIPDDNIAFSLKSILIDETIVEMTYRAFDKTLSKKDIVDFALLLDGEDEVLELQTHLVEPIRRIIEMEKIKELDKSIVSKVITALDLGSYFKGSLDLAY